MTCIVLLLFSGGVTVKGQVENPCDYLPLCNGNIWRMTTGVVQVEGTRNVGGITGTILAFSDGVEEVYACNDEGVFILQFSYNHEDCGRVTITFDTPILLVPTNAEIGKVRPLSSDIDAYCHDSDDHFDGSATGTVEVESFQSSMTVPAGTFQNIIGVALVVTMSAGGEDVNVDETNWFARGIGPVKYVDRFWGESGELEGGTVCGESIETPELNLKPYTPNGWSGPIVIANETGTSTQSEILDDADTLYIDIAGINMGPNSVINNFNMELWLDYKLQQRWEVEPPVEPQYYFFVEDYEVGQLEGGAHILQFKIDAFDEISETNENDNLEELQFAVNPQNAAHYWTLYR